MIHPPECERTDRHYHNSEDLFYGDVYQDVSDYVRWASTTGHDLEREIELWINKSTDQGIEIERLKARRSADARKGRTVLPAIGPLKPCPFDAGSRLVVIRTERYDMTAHPEWADDPDGYAYNVHCTSCAADGPWRKSQSGGEQFWNGVPGTERGGPLPGG